MSEMATRWSIAVMLLLPGLCGAQLLDRQPYLQLGTHTSVTVVWRTLGSSSSRVWYGSSPGALDKVVDGVDGDQHEVTIDGLLPETRYYYAVGTKQTQLAGATSQHWFRTAPEPGDEDARVRMWVVGDSGNGSLNQALVRDAMVKYTGAAVPNLYLHMGDMAYSSGTDLEFTLNFYGVYADVLRHMVIWPTLGNHEGKSSDSGPESGPYYDGYVLPRAGEAGGVPSGTEAYYSFDHGNTHFIVLDSYDSDKSTDGPMLTWLKEDLDSTDQQWIVSFFHHPPYTKGSHNSDTESAHIGMRENALPILEAGGVDLVLGGHSHIYERSFLVDGAYDTPTTAAGKIVDSGDGKPQGSGPYVKAAGAHQGAVFIVAGHGGASVKQSGIHPVMYFAEKDNGSCIIDVQGNRLTLHNVRKDGQVTDNFTLLKGPALLVTYPNGGEDIATNETVNVTWQDVNVNAPSVDIAWSQDGGDTWKSVAKSAPNSGTYSWKAPAAITATALLRVINSADPSVFDDSDVPFFLGKVLPKTYIDWASDWKYSDKGVDPGPDWTTLGYDDSGWAAGPAPLGYGDGDEATELFDDNPNVPSVLFRRVITLDAAAVSGRVDILHDDGMALWVNGELVTSKYLTLGTGFGLYGGITSDDNEISNFEWPAGGGTPFVEGENVVAVMVKQSNEGSSDLSFDLELQLLLASPIEPGDDGGGTTTGDSTTGDATGGDAATGGDTTGGDSTGGEATTADTTGGDATGGDATGGDTAPGDTGAGATGADSTTGDATGGAGPEITPGGTAADHGAGTPTTEGGGGEETSTCAASPRSGGSPLVLMMGLLMLVVIRRNSLQ